MPFAGELCTGGTGSEQRAASAQWRSDGLGTDTHHCAGEEYSAAMPLPMLLRQICVRMQQLPAFSPASLTVQLDCYLHRDGSCGCAAAGAELAGTGGSSLPEGYKAGGLLSR